MIIFERILDFITRFWDFLNPVIIIKPYEAGVVMRLGKIQRTIHNGIHFKLPFIETSELRRITAKSFGTGLSVITSDDIVTEISVMARYTICDIRKNIEKTEDMSELLDEITMSICCNHLSKLTYEKVKLCDKDVDKAMAKAVQKECDPYGVHIESLGITHINLHQMEIFFRRIKSKATTSLIKSILKLFKG
jgi:regulator of protease activity HflC (stomatin/prohibitin superfamily)